MGTLRSATTSPQGGTCNGVTLGEPVEIDGNHDTFEWDDAAFPNGTVAVVAGELIVTADDEDQG